MIYSGFVDDEDHITQNEGFHVDIVLWWHFHQPDYRVPNSQVSRFPWVRMHALRAYTDLPQLIENTGLAGMTINIVPSLSMQIEDVAAGRILDRHFLQAQQLSQGDDNAIAAAFENHAIQTPLPIRPLPRFTELQEKRRHGHSPTHDEAMDACVLFHLAWVGFTIGQEPPIQELFHKGAHFSENDLTLVLNRSLEVAAEVLPRLKRIFESGLVDLTATPLTHPILPLLLDTQIAKEATSEALAPRPFSDPHMAQTQIQEALSYHEQCFGRKPQAMWPAEGALSEATLDLFQQCGVYCVASDEELLRHSLRQNDRHAHLFPYTHERTGVGLLFRDRALSDAWGFQYRNQSPHSAIQEFQHGLQRRKDDGAQCVTVILDGENPFEFYPNAGEDHLMALAQLDTARFPMISPANVSATKPLSHLRPGSWINASLDIWAGDEEDRKAWDLLSKVHQAIELDLLSPDQKRKCETHLLAAESSDWFWWYGPEFQNPHRSGFDALFRSHLRAAMEAAGITDHGSFNLHQPIMEAERKSGGFSPWPFCQWEPDPAQEAGVPWVNALRVEAAQEQGSMHRSHHLLHSVELLAFPEGIVARVQTSKEAKDVWLHIECENDIYECPCYPMQETSRPMQDTSYQMRSAIFRWEPKHEKANSILFLRVLASDPNVNNQEPVEALPNKSRESISFSTCYSKNLEA
jgi:alpha-amylase/alpha-mannosidase (GH57 family)